MSINPLNDISKVYLEQVALNQSRELEIDEASYSAKAARAGKDIGKPGKAFAKIAKSAAERYGSEERGKKVAGAVLAKLRKEALDPVGKEDADIDNDGDTDKSDKYLRNRRKAIGDAIKKERMKESFSNWREELSEVMRDVNMKGEDQKITEKKVKNKIKINPNMGEAVENLGGTLLEMVEIDEMDYILESVYDELLYEGYEEDDIEDALEYALTEAKVTFGHDTAPEKKKNGLLVAAKSRLSSLKKSAKAAVARGARKVAKGALKVARKAEGSDKTPSAAHTKTRSASTYRGAGAGQKEKVSSGSYQAPTTAKKKAEKPSDPWEGSATTPPKKEAKAVAKKPAAKPKATAKTTKVTPKPATKPTAKAPAPAPAAKPKAKKKSKLDSLLADIRSEGTQFDEQSFDINPATHRQYQRIEKATKLQQATKGPESSAASSAVKRLGGSGVSLPLANSYEPSGDQLDEKTLTKKETAKKEKLVKSMKKNLSDFETRYPGRGKEVMYATATKIAKKTA